jgi:hypothetical protein
MDAVGEIYAKRRDATVGGEGGKEQFDKGALGELGAVGCVSDRVGDDAVYTCRNTRGCGDRPRRACFFLFFFSFDLCFFPSDAGIHWLLSRQHFLRFCNLFNFHKIKIKYKKEKISQPEYIKWTAIVDLLQNVVKALAIFT